jgi:hypothetical protein
MSYPPPVVQRDEVDPGELEFYDKVMNRYHRTHADAAETLGAQTMQSGGEYWGRLMNSPELGAHISQFGSLVRSRGERPDSYSHADRELVDQVLAVELDSNIVLSTHLPDALAVGVPLELVEAVRAGRDEDLAPKDLLRVQFIRMVVRGEVKPDLWNALVEEMGTRGTVDYAIFILFLQFTMRLIKALGLPDQSNAEIEQMIKEFKDGNRKVPEDSGLRFS